MTRTLRLLLHHLLAAAGTSSGRRREREGWQRSDNDVKKRPDLGMIGIIVARASPPGATAGVNLTSHLYSANSHPVRGGTCFSGLRGCHCFPYRECKGIWSLLGVFTTTAGSLFTTPLLSSLLYKCAFNGGLLALQENIFCSLMNSGWTKIKLYPKRNRPNKPKITPYKVDNGALKLKILKIYYFA